MTEQKFKQLKDKYKSLLIDLQYATCQDGWFNLIDRTLKVINDYDISENFGKESGEVKITCIKEKFSQLRIYTNLSVDHPYFEFINGVTTLGNELSNFQCEICGSNKDMGKLSKTWLRSVCLPCSFDLNKSQDWVSLENINTSPIGNMFYV
jgi:hypothetical protein